MEKGAEVSFLDLHPGFYQKARALATPFDCTQEQRVSYAKAFGNGTMAEVSNMIFSPTLGIQPAPQTRLCALAEGMVLTLTCP